MVELLKAVLEVFVFPSDVLVAREGDAFIKYTRAVDGTEGQEIVIEAYREGYMVSVTGEYHTRMGNVDFMEMEEIFYWVEELREYVRDNEAAYAEALAEEAQYGAQYTKEMKRMERKVIMQNYLP